MNRKVLVSILIAGLFLVPVLSISGPAQVSTIKIYTGPKIVFEERNNHESNTNSQPGNNPKGKPQPPSPGPDKWAVVIGIADYQGSANDLLYPDDDAMDMYNYLLSKGYPSGHIKLLTNRKATASNIVSAINWMNTQETAATSECVFFYSGHGTTYGGYNDGDDEYTDEAIVSYNLYMILDGQLRDLFSTYASQKIVFIFDSCFSGGMDDLIGEYTEQTYNGRVVDTACAEDQLSWDGDSEMSNGVFTYYYMQGLYTYSTAEDAQAYAEPLAHNAVQTMYDDQMDPQEYDTYTGNWQF
jgi:Caspase domain